MKMIKMTQKRLITIDDDDDNDVDNNDDDNVDFFFFFLALAGYMIRAAREMNEVVFCSFCLQP